ncbi:fumarylacetoacetate hydrolase family protein [Aeromicrobium sp. CTD01-1L150]|uniref:fumarylacetoacetate hydrolase family protein n=1 Tax=Aeromicrobium sp. CTD01-1L150 TaxID=3341830 RepID=UPI0035C1CE1D
MPWASLDLDGRPKIGYVHDDAVRVAHDDRTMIELVAAGVRARQDLQRELLNRPAAVIPVDEVTLAAPVPRPSAVRDALCFLDHMRGCMRALGRSDELGPVWSEIPAFYFANPAAVLGPRDDVAISPGSRWFDLELEVGVVIGTPGRDIKPADAENHVAGYTFFNDWTARDLQVKDLELGLGQGKGKDSAITLGPWLVTAEEVADQREGDRIDLRVAATVNGTTLAEGTTLDMDWTFAEVIAFASRGTVLSAGDVIGSGTLPGGCLLEHATPETLADESHWLQVGDVVSLHGTQLGSTRQTVVAADPVHPLRQR